MWESSQVLILFLEYYKVLICVYAALIFFFTFTKGVMFLVLSCLSVCQQDNGKTTDYFHETWWKTDKALTEGDKRQYRWPFLSFVNCHVYKAQLIYVLYEFGALLFVWPTCHSQIQTSQGHSSGSSHWSRLEWFPWRWRGWDQGFPPQNAPEAPCSPALWPVDISACWTLREERRVTDWLTFD